MQHLLVVPIPAAASCHRFVAFSYDYLMHQTHGRDDRLDVYPKVCIRKSEELQARNWQAMHITTFMLTNSEKNGTEAGKCQFFGTVPAHHVLRWCGL